MNNDINLENKPRKNKALAGAILLVVGAVLLVHQMDLFFFPFWLFTWPMILIAVGLYNGAKHNFRNTGWFIIFILGVIFLLEKALPGYDVGRITWPVMFIVFGIWLIMRRNHKWDKNKGEWDRWVHHKQKYSESTFTNEINATETQTNYSSTNAKHGYGDDYMDTVSVFGGVKKTILSKDFKGGDIVNIFGGAELDFTQADINGRVVLEITQIFGGTKIIVPSNWQVVSDIAAVFAGIDDKRLRRPAMGESSDKILVIKGVSIFAGVDIRSY